MHDSVASFYGGYDQTSLPQLPRLRVSRLWLAVAVALVVLLFFVAADVAALTTPPVKVQVTAVNWVVEGSTIASTAGFTVHGSQKFLLTETCQIFCYNFKGAAVSAPFQLVALSIVNQPAQFTNLTIQAPSSAYVGPLTVTLVVGSSGEVTP